MSYFYVIASGIGILGFFIDSDILFQISAISCFILLTISFLIRGFAIDKVRGASNPDREGYIIKLGFVSRIITSCVLYLPLYYFFPIVLSWVVIVWCLSSILNILNGLVNKSLLNKNQES